MYSIGPNEAQSESKDCEVLSSLRLAGMSGTLKAVLCERQLLLERSTGHSLSLRYDQIVRMRHRQLPLIQTWLFITGILLLIGATRVLTGSLSYWTGAMGGSVVLLWLIGRKPVLTIDTQNGDSHSLFGLDITLLKIRIIIERIQDGMSLKNAKEGLEELERKETIYPTAGLIESIKTNEILNAENNINASVASNDEESVVEEEILEAEISIESEEKEQEIGFNEHPAVERARRATQEIRSQRYQSEAHPNISHRNENDEGWWDNEPPPTPQAPSVQTNNQQSPYGAPRYSPNQFDSIQSQEQQPNFEMDMGFDFSMFEEPPTTQTPLQQPAQKNMNDEYRQTQNFNTNHSDEGSFLPSFPSTEIDHSILPSEFTESLQGVVSDNKKDILNTDMSLAENARRTRDEQQKFEQENIDFSNLNNIQRLKLGRDSTFRRLKVRRGTNQKRSQYELLRELVVNSLHKITSVSKNILKKKGRNNDDDKLDQTHSKTLDILRVQAKYSRQAEIAEAVRKLTSGNEELTEEEIEIIASTLGTSSEIEFISTEENEVPGSFYEMKSTSKVKAEIDNLPGIKRLD